jgi:hypothetical protein
MAAKTRGGVGANASETLAHKRGQAGVPGGAGGSPRTTPILVSRSRSRYTAVPLPTHSLCSSLQWWEAPWFRVWTCGVRIMASAWGRHNGSAEGFEGDRRVNGIDREHPEPSPENAGRGTRIRRRDRPRLRLVCAGGGPRHKEGLVLRATGRARRDELDGQRDTTGGVLLPLGEDERTGRRRCADGWARTWARARASAGAFRCWWRGRSSGSGRADRR